MKQVSKQQRDLNILNSALQLGFVINPQESFEDNCIEAGYFLIDEIDYDSIDTESVKLIGNTFVWTDKMGYTIEVSGEHPKSMYVVNSLGQVIELIID